MAFKKNEDCGASYAFFAILRTSVPQAICDSRQSRLLYSPELRECAASGGTQPAQTSQQAKSRAKPYTSPVKGSKTFTLLDIINDYGLPFHKPVSRVDIATVFFQSL